MKLTMVESSDLRGLDDGQGELGAARMQREALARESRAETLKAPLGDFLGPTKEKKPFIHQINKVPTVCPAPSRPLDIQ